MSFELEDLESILEKIKTIAELKKIVIIPGHLSGEHQYPQINWSIENFNETDAFFEMALKFGSGVIVLDIIKITDMDIENAISALDEENEVDVIRELEQAQASVEKIGLVDLTFLSADPPGIFSLLLHTHLYNLVFDESDEDENYESGYDKTSLSDDELDEAAKKLTKSQQFQIATKNAQKHLVAKRIFFAEL